MFHETTPVGFLVVGRKRPGFDTEWAVEIERRAWDAAQAALKQPVRASTPAVDDPSLRRVVDELEAAGCQTLVVLQPSMGDGRLAPLLAQLWPGPLVIWATPERLDSTKVSSCSLVGAHLFASLFRQLDHPFELVYGDPDAPTTRYELATATALCAAAARLRQCKIGLVAGHAPGFVNMHVDPVELSRQLGIQVQDFGLDEFVERIEAVPENEATDDCRRLIAQNIPREPGITDEDLLSNSRYYLAMRAMVEEERLDALAVRCWPELPRRLQGWPYVAMGRLADENRVVALEGDVDGAITAMLGRLLGPGVGYLTDWLMHDERSVLLWHPGHAALRMCLPESIRLARHFNNRLPLVREGQLAPGCQVTLARFWRCDGTYRITALEAETAESPLHFAGTVGLAVVEGVDIRQWFNAMCHEGMPHHVAVLQGHQTGKLRSLARMLRVRWIDT